MKKFFSNIKKYYKYAIRSAKAELKSEVADSYLNWLWWIIEPMCFMLIYVFVFGVIFQNKTPYFASFVFIGLTCWDFFNRMVSGSVKLIITFGLMIFQGVSFSWHIVLLIPIFIVLYIVSFGIGLLLMHFGVTINDLGNLTSIVLRMIFYLSGVFYNINTRLSGNLKFVLLRVNPAAFIMNEVRNVLLNHTIPNFTILGVWLLVGLLFCILGVHVIHKNENSYAKVI